MDTILKFVVTLVFPSQIASLLVSADAINRLATNVAWPQDNA